MELHGEQAEERERLPDADVEVGEQRDRDDGEDRQRERPRDVRLGGLRGPDQQERLPTTATPLTRMTSTDDSDGTALAAHRPTQGSVSATTAASATSG